MFLKKHEQLTWILISAMYLAGIWLIGSKWYPAALAIVTYAHFVIIFKDPLFAMRSVLRDSSFIAVFATAVAISQAVERFGFSEKGLKFIWPMIASSWRSFEDWRWLAWELLWCCFIFSNVIFATTIVFFKAAPPLGGLLRAMPLLAAMGMLIGFSHFEAKVYRSSYIKADGPPVFFASTISDFEFTLRRFVILIFLAVFCSFFVPVAKVESHANGE